MKSLGFLSRSNRGTRGRLASRVARSLGTVLLLALASMAGSALMAGDRALADASITFQPSPTSATCSSSSNLTVTVRDASGNLAANGTNVAFSTTLGYITTSRATLAGVVDAVLVIPDKQSGTAQVTATALGATGQRSLSVSCLGASTSGPAPIVAPATATAAPVAPSGPAPLTQAVQVRNFSYTPNAISAQAGQTITINVNNSGPAPHTFTIDGLTDTGSIAAGASKTVTFTPTQAGRLVFYCTIHGAAVMSGSLNVTAGGTAPTTTTTVTTAAPMAPVQVPQSMGRYGY